MVRLIRLLVPIGLGALLFATGCGGGGAPAPAEKEAAAEEPAAPVVDPATAGKVNGKVNFGGAAPEMAVIQMDAEPDCKEEWEAAGQEPNEQKTVVNDNQTLRWVFVYVKEGLPDLDFPTPSEPVVLDQDRCRYFPHVFGVQTGQEILIRNSDSLLHNINAKPANNRGFNFGQPREGMESTKTFTTPEIMIPVECDVHGWMQASIGVLDHPYFAVTGEDGSFSIENLPPGDYVLEAWHETLGTQTLEVTVEAQGTAEAEFTFQGS